MRRSYGSGSLTTVTDKAGNETWIGKWRDDGRQIKRRIGPKRRNGSTEGLTRKDAEARLRDLMATVRAEDVRARTARVKRAGEITIADVWDAYRADRGRALKASTIHDYGRTVEGWFVPHFGDQPVARITRADVDQLVAAMEQGRHRKRGARAGLAPKSIRNYLTTLSMLLNYAQRKGWVTENAAEDVTVPLDEQHDADELRFLRPHEVHDLVAAAARDDVYGRVDSALLFAAALTGLRQGELLALRWESVDLAASRVRVVRNVVRGQETTPKSHERRSVPLAPEVAATLTDLTPGGPDDLVFAHPLTNGYLSRTPLMRRYRKALRAAGLDETFRMHDLRHTFGSQMAAAGVDVRRIQAWMGHESLKTTERYLHYAPAHNDAEIIGRAFACGDPRRDAVMVAP